MKTRSFFSAALMVLIASTVMVACSKKDDNNNNNSNNPQITMQGMVFSNTSLHINAGVTVTWTNNDNMVHTVTANDASFDSGDIAVGGTFTHTFTTAGTVAYHCKYHANMTGSVIVVTP